MASADRLDSWKDIAQYMKRDISTCIKWAKKHGLPVYHIDRGSPRSSVFAFKSEIDRWFQSRPRLWKCD